MNDGAASQHRPIRRLDRATVERIAAGEVVERPASVVKELVENALDAGATTVNVQVRGGGLERIAVEDNGWGIAPDELDLAVERHATSKLSPTGPVEGIVSLGFRGEALAAIAAVARLRLVSRPPDRESAEGIAVLGGERASRFGEPRGPGTTVEVEQLFFNTPARRKFLGSPAREQVEVVRTLEQLYLARSSASLRLRGEAGELASLPATDDLAEAAAHVLGAEFPTSSFAVHAVSEGVGVDGVLARPPAGAANFSEVYLSVNGRAVQSRPIAQAVRAAFGDALPRTRFPVGVLRLRVDPMRVDVNVHPTKREVRLAAAREVEEVVRAAVRQGLEAATRVAEAPGTAARVERLAPAPPSLPPVRREVRLPPTPSGPGQRTLPLDPGDRRGPSIPPGTGRPALEILGPVDALYWVATAEDGLILVDQHAASERLLFDLLLAGGTVARQRLVEPVPLALTAGDRAALAAHEVDVRAAGFEVEPFGPGTLRVLAVPSYRGRSAPAVALIELLRELADGGRPTVPNGLEERRAASLACHAAIRAGDVVERERIAEILSALDRLPGRPRSCPHGRPILVHLPRARLDRWFLRSGA